MYYARSVVSVNESALRKQVCAGYCHRCHGLPLLCDRPEFHHEVMGGCDQESCGSGDLHGYRRCLVRCQSTGGAKGWRLLFQLHCGLWFAVG